MSGYETIVRMCEERRRLERERPIATVVDQRLLRFQNHRTHTDRRGRRWRKPS